MKTKSPSKKPAPAKSPATLKTVFNDPPSMDDPSVVIPCPGCRGQGMVMKSSGSYTPVLTLCSSCDGLGWVRISPRCLKKYTPQDMDL